ncbi:MAG: EMC3/TMCO1 family protein [Nanoarchaeota archaeon]
MVIELIQQYPKISIVVLASLVSFLISLVNYFVLDKEKMRDLKAKQKALQEEAKKHKDNPQKMMDIQKEIMPLSLEMMKHSFKPLLITMIPIIIFFGYLKQWYAPTIIAKSWIWWYIGGSIASSMIFRKLLKLP